MSMLQICLATQRDLPFVQAWVPHSAWETLSDQERGRTDPQEVVQFAHGLLQGLLSNPTFALMLMAKVADQPAGYLLGGAMPDTCTGEMQGFVLDLFVVPSFRRVGVGRTLLRAAEEHFARVGLRKAKLIAGVHNQAALRLVSTSGFQPDGLVGVKEW